jgi:hypothetical protein
VLGAQALDGGGDNLPEGCPWIDPVRMDVSIGYRYLHSHRHFVGDVEQHQRATARSEVNNQIELADFSANYKLTDRWSVTMSLPFMYAKRFSESTPQNRTHARGIGDLTFGARVWLWKPPTESRQNVQIGFSLKVPTGNSNTTDVSASTGTPRTVVVDQSIQLGDGKVGFAVDGQAYKGFGYFTVFASGSYLFNPANTNGVQTGRSRVSESIMSVPDQYLWRAGGIIPVPYFTRLVMSAGVRAEGVPVRDLIGKSLGFRRPGVAISLDPGLIYTQGKDQWSVNVPYAVYRNRKRSVTDIMDNTSGDAAFADKFLVVSYSRKF